MQGKPHLSKVFRLESWAWNTREVTVPGDGVMGASCRQKYQPPERAGS